MEDRDKTLRRFLYSPRLIGWGVIGLLFLSGLRAEEFFILGPRAMGMGGAGVAGTRGGLSTYWNPAALAPPKAPRVDTPWDLEMHARISLAATNDVLKSLADLSQRVDGLDIDRLGDDLAAGNLLSDERKDNIIGILDNFGSFFDSGTGLLTNATPGVSLRIGRFGFHAMGIVTGGGIAVADTDNLSLGNAGLEVIFSGNRTPTTAAGQEFQGDLAQDLTNRGIGDANRIAGEIAASAENAGIDPSDADFRDTLGSLLDATIGDTAKPIDPDNLISNNATGVNLRGLILQEYAFAYARPFFDVVSIGIAPKLLQGSTRFSPITIKDFDSYSDVFSEFLGGEEENTTEVGIDVGLLVQPLDYLSIGLVGKYLNSPEFDFAGPGSYRLDPQVRTGISVGPFFGFTVAADIDLTENNSAALVGFKSQILGGGIEWNGWDVLFLRTGMSENLAVSSDSPVFHGGLGLRFFGLSLDAAAALSTDFTPIGKDGTEVPERGEASLMVSWGIPLQ